MKERVSTEVPNFAKLAVAAAVVLVAAYSLAIALTFQHFEFWEIDEFLPQLLGSEARVHLIMSQLPVSLALVGALFGLSWWQGRDTPTTDRIFAASGAVAPLLLAGVTIWMHIPSARVLTLAILFGGSVFAATRGLRYSSFSVAGSDVHDPTEPSAKKPAEPSTARPSAESDMWIGRAHTLFLALFCVIWIIVALKRHDAYWSSLIDLGLFYELYDNAEGLLYSPTLGHSFLGEHFSPILLLLTPLVWLFRDPAVLLVVQVLAVCAGSWILSVWAHEVTGNRLLAACIGLAYFVSPPIQQALFYDFHMDLLEAPFLFGVLLCMHRGKALPMFACALMLWLTKEDTFIYTSVIGAYGIIVERKTKLGVALIAAGLIAGALTIGFIMPQFRVQPGPDHFSTVATDEGYAFLSRYSHLGSSGKELLATLIGNPIYMLGHLGSGGRVNSILLLLVPFGLLAFRARWGLLLLIPTLEMLVANPGRMADFLFYYGAVVMPFAAMAAVEGVREMHPDQNTTRRIALALTAVTVVLLTGHPASYLSGHHNYQSYMYTVHQSAVDEAVAIVPEGVSVSATGYLAVHLQPRRDVRMLPYGLDAADWIVFDLQRPAWPLSYDDVQRRIGRLARGDDYAVRFCADGVVVFERSQGSAGADDEITLGHDAACAIDAVEHPVIEAELTEQTAFRGRIVRDSDASNGAAMVVSPGDHRGPGHMLFGPYARLGAGHYEAEFVVRWDARGWIGEPDTEVAVIDVIASRGGEQARRALTVQDFEELGSGWVRIVLPFDVGGSESGFEFRVLYQDVGRLGVDVVRVIGD